MQIRNSLILVTAVLLAAPALARADRLPSSTDEARALAGRDLPPNPTLLAAPRTAAATSTDEARALARTGLPSRGSSVVSSIQVVSSTDEARGVAGGLLGVAPRTEWKIAERCGASCGCRRG